jgi:uncharacterized protein (DUF2126 family)/transglutaminase-like putative cysteine protease
LLLPWLETCFILSMTIQAALHHVSHYQYSHPVALGAQIVRLRPAPHCRNRVVSYSLTVEPAGHFVNWQQDPFANYLARLVFPEKVKEFKVTVDLVVEMSVYNPFDFFLEPTAERYPFAYSASDVHELAPYLLADTITDATPLLAQYIQKVNRSDQRSIDFLVGINHMVQQDIQYSIRMEPGVQTPEQTLAAARGSCRDSAWLLVQLMRHCGLAARFVSGYLIQLAPDVKALDGPSGTTVDFTDLHAWCEVYLPGAGWVGLDATSGLMAGEGHIPLACTPQPSSAAPIEGGVEASESTFAHEMTITRLPESPRVTKPYTEAQWEKVLALGEAVDADLMAGDVRLTMGGEPTFVATTDRDAREWNTDAQGPTKRAYATEIMHKLKAQYAKDGFVHMGQGKWYPGEPLPRWAFSIVWRADGQPIWHNASLLADERQPEHYTCDDARRFMARLTAELGLPQNPAKPYINPVYEDAWYYLWREKRLPVNVDVRDARLKDALERERLAKVFEQGLGAVVGYVLPLQAFDEAPDDTPDAKTPIAEKSSLKVAGHTTTRWNTGLWHVRGANLFLTPGDSAMGYRLPLDTLPWVHTKDHPYIHEDDPMLARAALPDAAAIASNPSRPTQQPDLGRQAKPLESAHWLPRTALCAQVRAVAKADDPHASLLYIFMPPVAKIESYLELVSAVERSAQALNLKVVIEGYPPPRDPRLKMLQVTPDPGVIEVNIQPVDNWKDLVDNTEFLYNAAFESRLSAEKFMTDGKHTGTGGGNHFVMGGRTPADSPFLRKPLLLASLLSTWHNHPSLSYLFSGMFIGPTSQAPRVDEARNDQVYELEIALKEIVKTSAKTAADQDAMPPWLIDRTLRNILVDITGNTHRSEFCIDKLYSPDSATGRLGLLELRAFEMPPHARMSVVQQLLLRAFIALYWKKPRVAPLSRWGTQLHDKFLLPHFVWQDIQDVVCELNDAGYAFDPTWFAPHFEFRFPIIGRLELAGMALTLRSALEPWHVMGEEGMAGGMARSVDSSLERVQVHLRNFNHARYVLTVNGHAVPLQSTGVVAEYVAGVRYIAWKPYSALHPSIGVHVPLIFDVVDTWAGRAIGGCQYHVAHPGGLSYENFPVNANEAESRRLNRFVPMGHTPGQLAANALSTTPAPAVGSPEFPFTLDLRQFGGANR